MKSTRIKPPPVAVPRLDSLLHRLQHAPGAEGESYLDQLMIFLDDPPPGTGDRWKEGAAMCTAWGIPCSPTSVWRLYRSHVLEWRHQIAAEASVAEDKTPEAFAEMIERMVARRSFEVLANPHSNPAAVMSASRLTIRQQALDLARKKHEDHEMKEVDKAISGLTMRVMFNREASFALGKLKEALKRPPLTREQFLAQYAPTKH